MQVPPHDLGAAIDAWSHPTGHRGKQQRLAPSTKFSSVAGCCGASGLFHDKSAFDDGGHDTLATAEVIQSHDWIDFSALVSQSVGGPSDEGKMVAGVQRFPSSARRNGRCPDSQRGRLPTTTLVELQDGVTFGLVHRSRGRKRVDGIRGRDVQRTTTSPVEANSRIY